MKNAIKGFLAALILVGCLSATEIERLYACYYAGYTAGLHDRQELGEVNAKTPMGKEQLKLWIEIRAKERAAQCGCH